MKDLAKTYLRYGVPSPYAKELEAKGISKSTFNESPKKNLISNYSLNPDMVDMVKLCIQRNPIDENVMQSLLEKNAFSCCLCKKQTSFIIHHITEYSEEQDNSYNNLAVLCLGHHDDAHKKGKTLTRKITPAQIKIAKTNWEYEVAKHGQELVQNFSKLEKRSDLELHYSIYSLRKSGAHKEKLNVKIAFNTTFILKVEQEESDQEFVVYLSVKTNKNEQKWIGFATVGIINNRVYRSSEHVFRIGRSGKKIYKIVENIMEKINESGLDFKGIPTTIEMIRFRGINDSRIDFYYDFKES